MFGIGVQELLIVLIIILVLFGGKKLPELSRSLGQAIRELRQGFKEDGNEETAKTSSKKDK